MATNRITSYNVCYTKLLRWRALRTIMSELYSVDSEELYYSILPTATQYARNAIFSGLMPLQIKQMYPDLWTDEEEEEST